MFSLAPIWQNAIQNLKELWPVVWYGDVAKFVRDDIIDGVHRRLDQSAIEQQAAPRGHRAPALPKVANDQALGTKVVGRREAQKIYFKALSEFCMRAFSIPRLYELARHLGPLGPMRLNHDKPTGQSFTAA